MSWGKNLQDLFRTLWITILLLFFVSSGSSLFMSIYSKAKSRKSYSSLSPVVQFNYSHMIPSDVNILFKGIRDYG